MKIFYAFLFICISVTSFAQEFPAPTIIQHSFQSKAFDTERNISISLPTGYSEKDSSTTYLVAYLFDGQFNPYFSMVSSISDYYSQIDEGVPIIIVSIHTQNRSLEFTPKWNHQDTYHGWQGNVGNAEVMTQHLKEEVIPYVNANYHTKKYKLGIGHSLGGTYVISEIFKDSSLFDGVIAVSPNLNYDHEQLIDTGKEYFKNHPKNQTFIFTTAGDKGGMERSFARSVKKLDSIAEKEKSENLNWETRYLIGDGHMSSFPTSFNYAYLAFSKKWLLSEDKIEKIAQEEGSALDAINTFYAKLSDFSGEKTEPTMDELNTLAYGFDYYEEYKKALEVINHAIARYPNDPNLRDSKGEILAHAGKHLEARNSYQAGLDLLAKNPDYYEKDQFDYYKGSMEKSVAWLSDEYITYQSLIKQAKELSAAKNYKKASKLYSKAFKMTVFNGSHIDRISAVETFAQANKLDAAFEQLELLNSHFGWRGSERFEENKLMTPLKKDSRWKKAMVAFDKNKE